MTYVLLNWLWYGLFLTKTPSITLVVSVKCENPHKENFHKRLNKWLFKILKNKHYLHLNVLEIASFMSSDIACLKEVIQTLLGRETSVEEAWAKTKCRPHLISYRNRGICTIYP